MSNSQSSGSQGGVGCSTVLFLIFLVLKLTGNVTWSWWWVTSPLWITGGVVLLVVIAILVCAVADINRRTW